jgi:hypothetical protein
MQTNPKSELRNSKAEMFKTVGRKSALNFEISEFEFVSDFGFRISSF